MTEWIDRAQKCLITILTVLHHLSGEITRIKFSFGAVCQSPIELTLSSGVCLLCKISWVPFALALAGEEPTQPLTHQFTELTLESFWVLYFIEVLNTCGRGYNSHGVNANLGSWFLSFLSSGSHACPIAHRSHPKNKKQHNPATGTTTTTLHRHHATTISGKQHRKLL